MTLFFRMLGAPLAALAVTCVTLHATADQAAPQRNFPLDAGLTWKYHAVTSNTSTKKVFEDVDIVRKVSHFDTKPDGATSAHIDESKQGFATESAVYQIRGSEVSLLRTENSAGGIKSDTPQPTLRGDLKPSASWAWKGKLTTPLGESVCTVKTTVIGAEDITVPAGTFHAIHLKRKLSTDLIAERVIDDWYAHGVGLVMNRDTVGPFQTVLKLTGFQAAAAPAASVDGSKLSVGEFFPLTAGSRWVYSGSRPIGENFEIKVVRLQAGTDKTGTIAILERTAVEGGKASGAGVEARLFVSDGELRPTDAAENDVYRLMELRFSSPALKLPMKTGTTWEARSAFKLNGNSARTKSTFSVAGLETVNTPAGKFEAWRVHEALLLTPDSNPAEPPAAATVDTWFAPKVGVIKRVVKSPLGDFEQTLQSYQIK